MVCVPLFPDLFPPPETHHAMLPWSHPERKRGILRDASRLATSALILLSAAGVAVAEGVHAWETPTRTSILSFEHPLTRECYINSVEVENAITLKLGAFVREDPVGSVTTWKLGPIKSVREVTGLGGLSLYSDTIRDAQPGALTSDGSYVFDVSAFADGKHDYDIYRDHETTFYPQPETLFDNNSFPITLHDFCGSISIETDHGSLRNVLLLS